MDRPVADGEGRGGGRSVSGSGAGGAAAAGSGPPASAAGALREAAAAAAWYAYLLIQDLVSLFGPVVKSLCVIRECVAVVELERAPFSGAVAWAAFSGAGAYTLQVKNRTVEAVTYSGQARRTGPIMEDAYVKPLQDPGWTLKQRRPG